MTPTPSVRDANGEYVADPAAILAQEQYEARRDWEAHQANRSNLREIAVTIRQSTSYHHRDVLLANVKKSNKLALAYAVTGIDITLPVQSALAIVLSLNLDDANVFAFAGDKFQNALNEIVDTLTDAANRGVPTHDPY